MHDAVNKHIGGKMAKGWVSPAVFASKQRKQANWQARRAQQAAEAAAAGISVWDIRQAAWNEVQGIRKAAEERLRQAKKLGEARLSQPYR